MRSKFILCENLAQNFTENSVNFTKKWAHFVKHYDWSLFAQN